MSVALTAYSADELTIDHVMVQDPAFVLEDIRTEFDPRLPGLWLKALRRPDSELQRMAADTIAIAQQRGVPNLKPLSKDLAELLGKADLNVHVRRAVVRALIALDAKEHAALLTRTATASNLEVAALIEPALGRWSDAGMRNTWLKRLDDPTTPPLPRMLAIEGIGTLKLTEAKAKLLNIALTSYEPPHHRLAAARSAAAVTDASLFAEAAPLLADKSTASIANRVLGVTLLTGPRDDATVAKLRELATDEEPAVATIALQRLLELDPRLVLDLAPAAIAHRDANIRNAAAEAYLVAATPESIAKLAPLLDDPDPTLRKRVAKKLVDFAAKAELRGAVLTATDQVLATQGWRGLEQAVLLAGHLDHEPAVSRLIELLEHPRGEVALVAGWSLRKLKLSETLPTLLAYGQKTQAGFAAIPAYRKLFILGQLCQIFELFGELRYRESHELLRRYVPKDLGLHESRFAACWALGKIFEGELDAPLAERLVERLNDTSSPMPEVTPMRRMCAVSLGRMKAMTAVEDLRRYAADWQEVGQACWWSLEKLTGDRPPKYDQPVQRIPGWFIQPSEDLPKAKRA